MRTTYHILKEAAYGEVLYNMGQGVRRTVSMGKHVKKLTSAMDDEDVASKESQRRRKMLNDAYNYAYYKAKSGKFSG